MILNMFELLSVAALMFSMQEWCINIEQRREKSAADAGENLLHLMEIFHLNRETDTA